MNNASLVVAEVAKRLQPKGDVLRELFLKSGNLCAFPGCNHLIMDPQGAFVGEICHIEAAEPGGERFNSGQTNEERRGLQNLILLCHRHHVITGDVSKYPVARMQQMKSNHEDKVNDFATHLQFRVVDLTKRQIERPTALPRTLGAVLKWNLTDEQLVDTAEQLNKLLRLLKRLPRQARELLVVAIERSGTGGLFGGRYFSPEEVDIACGLRPEKTLVLWGILDRMKIAWDMGDNETGCVQFRLGAPGCDWDVWGNLLAFQVYAPGALHELIVDLNFSLLD